MCREEWMEGDEVTLEVSEELEAFAPFVSIHHEQISVGLQTRRDIPSSAGGAEAELCEIIQARFEECTSSRCCVG